MASKTLHSNTITFLDYTDGRKLDVYITSNLPTSQIFDSNNQTYSPNWVVTNLELSANAFLDSQDVTLDENTKIEWYMKIGSDAQTYIKDGNSMTVAQNIMSGNVTMITYICDVYYQDNIKSSEQITFTRIDTGLNGSNGKDGTSVTILGSYNTLSDLQAAHPIGSEGDSYIVDGDLYVWAANDAIWENVGSIEGPAGKDGQDAKSIILNADAQVFKVSKTGEITPKTIILTSQEINTTATSWTYSTNGGQTFLSIAPDGISRNGNIVTITGADITSNMIVVKASDGTYSDTYTIYKVFDGVDGATGQSASMVFLTNENITFSANQYGQISTTSIATNVVAYSGTTKVTPTIGNILDLPDGITINKNNIIEVNNELILTFTVANNSTLGSPSSNSGAISIPITSPVNTILTLSWSKINTGATGAGINSVTVTYGESTSASTQPTSWQSSVPTVAEGSYLWTRTITDYTDTAIPDTVTYTYAKQGVKGDTGSAGSSVTVSKIEYQEGTFSTAAPNGTWSSSVVSVADGNYLWTKTTFSDGKVAYGVARQGIKGDTGDDGRGVSSIVEQYYQSTSATAQSGGTWSSSVPAWADGKYIWTRSVITYTDSSTSTTSPVCVTGQKGGTGNTGVGISSIDVWYYQSTSATALSGGSWVTTAPTWIDGKYVWTKTITTYTNNTTDETDPVCITGQRGSQGVQGPKGNDGQQYYTWVKYADTPTSGMSNDPDGKIYIGLAYNKTTATESNTYSDYTWSLIKGETGAVGPKGEDGQQYYTWIKYADNASGSNMSDSPNGKSYIGLAYNKTTSTESTTASDYTWALFKGDKGDKGTDAYTVMLTNESHVFAGNVSSATASSATTQVLAYKGSTAQSVTIVSVDGKTASTSSTATSVDGLSFACSALSGTSPAITFTCTTSFVSPSGTIPIVLTVDGVTITKMFTYSIAFKGAQGSTGTAASLVNITPSALYFKSTTGKNGAFTPDYIYLYPRFQAVTYSKWEYSTDGGTTWIAASGANGLTISTYSSVANTLRIAKTSTLYTDTVTSISFRCVSSNASVYDTVSIAKIYDVVDLNIGGRNYIQNSGVEWVTPGMSSNSAYGVYKNNLNNIFELLVGKELMISFEAKIETVDNALGQIRIYGSNGSPKYQLGSKSFTNITPNQWQRFETSISITHNTSNTGEGRIEFYGNNATTTKIYIKNLKLEVGNKATDWSPAPEDLNNITFQIYAPNGYLLTNKLQSLTLQTFAYEGSLEIASGATFQWYHLIDDIWTAISGATGKTLTVTKSDVLRSKSYRCVMTYKSKTYTSTITVQDKTDVYESIMCISSNTRGNDCYWVLYTLVYTDAEEVDPLLGQISISAPSSPTSGDYWYAVDETNASVQLKKYNGTSWEDSTDTQSLSYYWDIVNNGSEKVPFGDHSKVQVVSCNDFTSTATLVCGVNNAEDGLLTQSSLSLTDASDPIVSVTEPSNVIDGQLWIKPNNNGTYIMSIWDATNDMWVVNDMDTRTKVHTSKPSAYSVGDLWITASDTEHSGYLEGTLLMANTSSSAFSESHWSTTLKYDKDLDSIKETLNDLSQYVNITSEGLKIGAQSASGEISPFTSLFTSTELAFYQNSERLLTLANSQLTAPRIVVENDLDVQGTISLGNLNLVIESNGSFSFAVSK